MVAGLMQLSAQGQLNIPLFNNPSISFFNYAYKRHYNFAMENIIHNFTTKPSYINTMHEGGHYDIDFTKVSDVDLLANLSLVFKLPDIYSSDKFKFKWIEHAGTLLIKNASFYMNNVKIDTITGEWLIIWNELTMSVKDGYNNMTGNIPELTNPRTKNTIYRISNNIISEYDYLSSTKENINNPSIKGRYVTIPLSFWFSKHSSLAIPLLRLLSNTSYNVPISLRIEFENIEKLYTIYSDVYNMHISPLYYNYLNNTRITINDFIISNMVDTYVEATYIILDVLERKTIIELPILQYLLETRTINTKLIQSGGDGSIRTIDINSQLLVKEIIWTLKRADSVEKFNDNLNFTYSIPKDNEKSIMKSASIVWLNQYERVEDKSSYFYNCIQPYQNHSSSPRQGIYSYSYSIYPDKWFPSGCYNSASITSKIIMKLNEYKTTLLDDIYEKKFNDNYKISNNNNDIIVTNYIIQYNILEFQSGQVGIKNQN
jgi:hypothetical protein